MSLYAQYGQELSSTDAAPSYDAVNKTYSVAVTVVYKLTQEQMTKMKTDLDNQKAAAQAYDPAPVVAQKDTFLTGINKVYTP